MRPEVAGIAICVCLLTAIGHAQRPPAAAREPGKVWPWTFNHIPQYIADQHASAADLKAIEANLQKIVSLINATPMLSPPMGFDVRFTGTLDGPDPDFARRVTAMSYWLEFAFMDYLPSKSNQARHGTFPNHGLSFHINDPYKLMHGSTANDRSFSQRWWKDTDGEFWIEPPSEEFQGMRIYRIHDIIAVTRDGAPGMDAGQCRSISPGVSGGEEEGCPIRRGSPLLSQARVRRGHES